MTNDKQSSVEHRFYLHSSNNEIVELNLVHTNLSFNDSHYIKTLVRDFYNLLTTLNISKEEIVKYINTENIDIIK